MGGLAAGKIAYVSTDHAPWPKDRKTYTGDISSAPGSPACSPSRR